MKKVFSVMLFAALLLPLTFCTEKPDVEPGASTTEAGTTVETIDTVTTTVGDEAAIEIDDKFDNTEWLNVLAVLQESLEAESSSSTIKNKLAAGEALVLAAKYIKENMSVADYGFTQDDIDTYVNYANMKFNEVIEDPKATELQIAEANQMIAEGAGL